jgi:predicted nucleotidyltransferase component of viral defense system
MILQRELRDLSEQLKVPMNTIDKDYVLGHFLNGIFQQDWALESLVFKGGTCLKKCYFENYRFSEDLDINIINETFKLTKKHIQQVCRQVNQVTEISFNIMQFKPVLFDNKPVGWDVEICFWGANHEKSKTPVFGKDCHSKIWCEFRSYELMLFAIESKDILHNYSDKDLVVQKIPCYSIHEILAEKMRALIQRNRGEARDYYDLWYIKTHVQDIEWNVIKDAFFQKCDYKNIFFNGAEDFFKPERLKQVEVTWEKRLNHQLPKKVNRISVLEDLQSFFYQLFDELVI